MLNFLQMLNGVFSITNSIAFNFEIGEVIGVCPL